MSFIMGGVLNQQPRSVGVPVWLSRLRIWHCHYSGLGHYIDMGSIPGLGTSTCHGCDPKMKQSKTKTKKEPRRVEWNLFFLPYTCKYHSEIGINHQPMPKKKKMNLKCILLSERIQSEEGLPCMTPFIWHPGTGETKMANRLWGGGLKHSRWYFGDGYLPPYISLIPWIFTTQVNHNIFKFIF